MNVSVTTGILNFKFQNFKILKWIIILCILLEMNQHLLHLLQMYQHLFYLLQMYHHLLYLLKIYQHLLYLCQMYHQPRHLPSNVSVSSDFTLKKSSSWPLCFWAFRFWYGQMNIFIFLRQGNILSWLVSFRPKASFCLDLCVLSLKSLFTLICVFQVK